VSDQNEPSITQAPVTVTPSLATPPVAAAVQRGNGVAFFALLFSIVALLAVGAIFYRDDTKREISDFRTQTMLQSQADTLSQLHNMLDTQRAESRTTRDQFTSRFNELQNRVETQQQQLTTLATADRSEWQLTEAEYLLQLANQRLLFGGDPKTALEQLLGADNIIHSVDDSGLLPTRAALAKDIAALKAVDVVDTDGIYFELEAVATQAQQLHLIESVAIQEEAPLPENKQATLTERFQTGLRAALHKLYQLVQIRRRDEPYKPLLAPQYEAALQQNLKLTFEQAQVALLMNNQKLYEHSLSKARDWLLTYYTIDEHATQAVVSQIDELIGKRVEMTLPDISESRRELKAYIKMRQAQLTTAAGAKR
jgi:uroporphyrin-III C-methyltransferase